MAGQAWLTQKPTTTCDLKNDQDAPIQSGARAVNAQAAIAIPIKGSDEKIRAIVGFAFAKQFTFDDMQIRRCTRVAHTLLD
jgi:hypothetical protein